jgi:transcriptional regulator GlxA family with amidase domain
MTKSSRDASPSYSSIVSGSGTSIPGHRRQARAILRRLGRAALAAGLAAATLTGVVLAGTSAVEHDYGLDRTTHLPAGIAPVTWAPQQGTVRVAVVLGRSGTEAADVLAPYEVFTRSPKFSVTTVAADNSPVQLVGGPALVPSTTFSDIDSGKAPAPDLLVIPAVSTPAADSEAGTRSWIAGQAARGINILGVCSGAKLLAAAGVLDGHRATSHWSGISGLRESRPAVQWVAGQRYVQDRHITTTAGVTSGIPGALKLVNDLAGPAEAARVGAEVGYPGWPAVEDPGIPVQSFSMSDATVGLNAVLPWLRPTIGVGLTDGIEEIDAVAAFEVYAVSGAARAVAVASGPSITTRHGLVLLTTPASTMKRDLDRLILPGPAADDTRLTAWAAGLSIPTLTLTEPTHPGTAFDGALEELARNAGRATALATAKFIDYPAAHLQLDNATADTRSIVLFWLAIVLAVAAGSAPALIRTVARR